MLTDDDYAKGWSNAFNKAADTVREHFDNNLMVAGLVNELRGMGNWPAKDGERMPVDHWEAMTPKERHEILERAREQTFEFVMGRLRAAGQWLSISEANDLANHLERQRKRDKAREGGP